MSYTTLYGVPEKGSLETVAEYRNGWGSAPVIWDYMWKKYLSTPERERNYESAMHPAKNLEEICALVHDGKVVDFESLCMQLTFNDAILRKEDFEKAAAALETMFLVTNKEDRVNHLKTIATDLRDKDKWADYIGCCFRHTSVGDEWTVYTPDDDSRLYDISIDDGHWFITEKSND